MLKFYYNVLVDEENFADRKEDILHIFQLVENSRKVCLFAPRRYGKSSLAKNIIPKKFVQKFKKKALPIYIDFMGAEDENTVVKRISHALVEALGTYVPQKMLAMSIQSFFKNLAVTMQPDPNTGMASFEIKGNQGMVPEFSKLLKSIASICHTYKAILIFDEFQDIHHLKSTQGELRSFLQTLKDVPMIFLGSKKKVMIQMFLNHNGPFFGFATEFLLAPIPLEAWLPFFEERLAEKKIKLGREALQKINDISLSVPNTICEIGAYIFENFENKTVGEKEIEGIVRQLIIQKKMVYQEQMLMLSSNELKVCRLIAKQHGIKQVYSGELANAVELTPAGMKKIVSRLYQVGIVEEDASGYRISNPLLGYYLESEA